MNNRRFGDGVRALRQRRGWRQQDLADAAGISRSAVGRIEQGRADRLTVMQLDRVATALEARIDVRLLWQHEQLDRLIDAVHAELVELVVEELTGHGWMCAAEVTFSVYGERGSIDVLAFHEASGVVLVVEVKSSIPEIGNLLAPLDRKVRHASRVAADRGWKARSVARLLVIAGGSTVWRRLDEHRATFEAAFPVRGHAVRRWIRAPERLPRWSGLWVPSLDRA
jgi:transcriptional regulator with XRE-family HTH domain